MLTRDIDVRPAIVELIDNSIDGAKKIRKNKEYKGLFIKINMSQDRFIIEDNCGGIDIETAQKYAFQFGRSSDRESDSSGYFTGIFGIGMKRALFKLGKKFEVISKTSTEYFDLKVDVDDWINKPEWEFEFDKVETGMNNDETGTKIVVEKLNADIVSKFESELFINSLIDYIQKYRTVEAENGLDIEVNNIAVDYGKEKLLKSKDIQPYEKQIIDDSGKITIIAGITNKGEPNKAGWYIYCNGRLVVYADKTEFRGYVYFESQNLLELPWNTTKTGIDTSNRLYVIARQSMSEAMKQVIKVIDEAKRKHDVSNLDELDFVKKAGKTELNHSTIANISENKDFNITEVEPEIPMVRISFSKPLNEVERVKENMGERTNKAVGEKLFEYYCEMEGI